MKKLLIAAFVILGLSAANAQVTFKPGIRAGANFSHFTQGEQYFYDDVYYDEYNQMQYYNARPADFTSKADFYVGVYGALHLTKYYTLQPEINYTRQGSNIEFLNQNNILVKTKLDVSYISVAVINKFTFSDKLNIHVGPTIDVVVDQPRNFYANNYSRYNDVDAEIDLAFVLGVGYNFTKNLGIEARVKKGIIPVLDFSNSNHTNVVFSAGLTYTFDVK